jgi:hypothetical protein
VTYVVVSRHHEDLGLGRPLAPGSQFEEDDVPDAMKDRLAKLVDMKRVREVPAKKSSAKKATSKNGGE